MRVLYLAVSPDGQTIVTGALRGGAQRSCWQALLAGAAGRRCWKVQSLLRVCCATVPDGSETASLPAGAGDETLRFWNVFPGPKSSGPGSDAGMGAMARTLIR